MDNYLLEIDKLIQNNDRQGLKSFLDTLPENIKGKAFEGFISDIYRGNGWLTDIKGSRKEILKWMKK